MSSLKLEIDHQENCPPPFLDPENHGGYQTFGETPRLGRGSTNINIPVSKGIPSVCIGRGGQGGGAHSLHEWYLNDEESDESIQLALSITLSEAGLAK